MKKIFLLMTLFLVGCGGSGNEFAMSQGTGGTNPSPTAPPNAFVLRANDATLATSGNTVTITLENPEDRVAIREQNGGETISLNELEQRVKPTTLDPVNGALEFLTGEESRLLVLKVNSLVLNGDGTITVTGDVVPGTSNQSGAVGETTRIEQVYLTLRTEAIALGTVAVTVFDVYGNRIEGADINLAGPVNVTRPSGANGTWNFYVPAGTYAMSVNKTGYLQYRQNVTVQDDQIVFPVAILPPGAPTTK